MVRIKRTLYCAENDVEIDLICITARVYEDKCSSAYMTPLVVYKELQLNNNNNKHFSQMIFGRTCGFRNEITSRYLTVVSSLVIPINWLLISAPISHTGFIELCSISF